ncbi:MAG: DUF2721 domain-containing protein [Chitinophagaceae bacterium]
MDISLNTPALLFPAISLVMLAYTNRFLALASVIRQLHDKYKEHSDKEKLHKQIKSLRYRIKLIKIMQALGVASFMASILSMYFIYIEYHLTAKVVFSFSLILFAASLAISLLEIQHSTKALEIELSDIEGLEDPTVIEYLKSKFERD